MKELFKKCVQDGKAIKKQGEHGGPGRGDTIVSFDDDIRNTPNDLPFSSPGEATPILNRHCFEDDLVSRSRAERLHSR